MERKNIPRKILIQPKAYVESKKLLKKLIDRNKNIFKIQLNENSIFSINKVYIFFLINIYLQFVGGEKLKKSYLIILCLILVFLSMLCVSAGFWDDFFSGSSNDNAKFMDVGTSDNFSTDWYDVALTVKRDTAGTNISNKASSNSSGFHIANKPDTPSKSFSNTQDWDSPFTVEFDVISCNNKSNTIQLYDGDNELRRSFSQLKIVDGSHVKFTSDGSSVVFNVDQNDPITVKCPLNSKSRIGFCIVPNGDLKYKNFWIY